MTAFHRALVTNTVDPEERRRVRLRIPHVLGPLETSWSRPLFDDVDVPLVGETVWVAFENGDHERPVYVPRLVFGVPEPEPEPDPNVAGTVYVQALPPTGNLSVGDLWYDTTQEYRPYRWTGTSWSPLSGRSRALEELVRLRTITHSGTGAPTEAAVDGSLYVDTSTGDVYRRISGVWVSVAAEMEWIRYAEAMLALTALGTAQGRLDGVALLFAQPVAPVGPSEGDVWLETDADTLRVYLQESWVVVNDSVALDALQSVLSKLDVTDSRARSLFSTSEPAGEANDNGDLWFDVTAGQPLRVHRREAGSWILLRDSLEIEADLTVASRWYLRQEGAPNLLPKPYTDFQYQQTWYGGTNLTLSIGTVATRETVAWTGNDDVASRGLRLTGFSDTVTYVQLRPIATPFNIRVAATKKYIVSAYVRNNHATDPHTMTIRAWGSNNASLGSTGVTLAAGESQRLTFVTDAVPAGVAAMRVEFNVNSIAADVTIAGVQVEELLGGLPAPSIFKPGPEIGDGGMIKTGSLQSTNYIPNVQGWNIALDGSAEFNDVTVRGDVHAAQGEILIDNEGIRIHAGTDEWRSLRFVDPASPTVNMASFVTYNVLGTTAWVAQNPITMMEIYTTAGPAPDPMGENGTVYIGRSSGGAIQNRTEIGGGHSATPNYAFGKWRFWSDLTVDGHITTLGAFSRARGVNQTITHASWTNVNFSSFLYNEISGTLSWNGTSLRVDVLAATTLDVSFALGWAQNSTGRRILGIFHNGSVVAREDDVPFSAGSHYQSIGINGLNVAAGDYIELMAYQNSGGNLDIGGIPNTRFFISKTR